MQVLIGVGGNHILAIYPFDKPLPFAKIRKFKPIGEGQVEDILNALVDLSCHANDRLIQLPL